MLIFWDMDKFLDSSDFKCTKCGECCRPIVKVSENAIKRIEESGWKREDFLDVDPISENYEKNTLKQVNRACMFLKREGKEFVCSIYEHRPDTCRKYPFIMGNEKLTDCRPKNWEKWMPIEDVVMR